MEKENIEYSIYDFAFETLNTKVLKYFSLLKFCFYLNKFSPDFIFPFTYYPNIICCSIWRFTKAKKCFWSVRGSEFMQISFLEKICIWNKPHYISNSLHGSSYIIERHKIKKKQKVYTIFNSIESTKIKNDKDYWLNKIKISEKEFVAIMVANFFKVKNHKYLIKSWCHFVKNPKNKNAKLILVGYSPTEQDINSIKSLAFDLNLNNNLIFLESCNDIAGLLQICNVGILTSSSEGCSNTILEYVLNELPVIASKIQSNIEILGEDYPNYLDFENYFSLSENLNQLTINNPKKSIVEKKNQILSKYSSDQMKTKYLKVIDG